MAKALFRTGLVVALAFAAFSSPAHAASKHQPSASPADVPTESLPLIHDALVTNIATGQIPGGVVLVAKDGKIVHFEARGLDSFGGHHALHKDSLFGIASLSKPVTAVAILMLMEEGKINLDDPVSKYIPEFGVDRVVRALKPGSPPPPFSALPGILPPTSEYGPPQYAIIPLERQMTVLNLITHTSGIQIFGVANDAMPQAKPGQTLSDVIPKLAQAPLEYQPGSRWAYSNGPGFEVLGRIVEIVSGQHFDKFLQERVFSPLEMKDTGFGVRDSDVSRAIGVFPGAPIQLRSKTSYLSGSAGLWSSVEDYSHFAEMLANGGQYKGRRLLKPETVKAMSSNQIGPLTMGGYPPMAIPPEGVKFGYGVLTVTDPAAAGTNLPKGSFGWDGVGTRRFWAVPGDRVVIVSMVPLVGPAAAPFQRVTEAAVVKALMH